MSAQRRLLIEVPCTGLALHVIKLHMQQPSVPLQARIEALISSEHLQTDNKHPSCRMT